MGYNFFMLPSQDKIIVALDSNELEDCRKLTDELGDLISFYKIGLRMFVTDGFNFASHLKHQGKRIFLDLKLFDIKSTITETVSKLSNLGIDFLTVHGDPSVVEAALIGKKNNDLKILAVTFLTSHNRADLNMSLIKKGAIEDLILERATNAINAGADGLIASPLEVTQLRSLKCTTGKIIVAPGIRPGNSDIGDQKRISTPSEALAAGADYLVIGRPIWQSKNPRLATEKILNDL